MKNVSSHKMSRHPWHITRAAGIYYADAMRAFRWLLFLTALVPVLITAQQVKDAANPDGKWEVLEGCRLATNSVMDGDSFKVTHKGRGYIFRLYFVDAPEIDPSAGEPSRYCSSGLW